MKFDIISIDYPWDFEVWDRDTGQGRSAAAHYKTQHLDWIKSIRVEDIAAENCAVFMWAVWPRIFDPRQIVDAWNSRIKLKKHHFKYKTLAWEWIKLNKLWYKYYRPMIGDNHKLLERLFFFGMGFYTRANCEPCLLFVRGRMPRESKAERNILLAPIGAHSSKPAEHFAKIERLYPSCKYPRRAELFARDREKGWHVFGNDPNVQSDFVLDDNGNLKCISG